MIVHENPEAAILELLGDDGLATDAVVLPLIERTRPDQVKYAKVDRSSSASSRDGMTGSEFVLLDPHSTVNGDSRPATLFDIVIVPSNCKRMKNLPNILRHLTTMLKPMGKLLCGGDEGLSQHILNSNKGLNVILNSSHPACPLSIFSSPSVSTETNGHSTARSDMLIIEPPIASTTTKRFSELLVQTFYGLGINAKITQWNSDLPGVVISKHCISLLELEESHLESLSGPNFSLVKDITLKAASLLWITGFDHPSSSLATGLLRVIRRENLDQQLQILHLSSQGARAEYGPVLVAKILTASSQETEFLEKDGLLKISRLSEDPILNADIQSHMGVGTHMMPIKECNFPLQLTIGRPGLLDTLYFQPHDKLLLPLADDEVEIQVMASGVK